MSLASARPLAAAPPELITLGNQIVTKVGHCPVRLKGVDVPGLEWSNTGDGPSAPNKPLAVVQWAVGHWACNFIRLPLNQDRWLGTGCGASAASYQALVQGVVDWCNANNVYVLLDLHWNDLGTAGGNSVCTSGQHDMPDDNSTLFWQSVASAPGIANNPAVFFDLYNEPGGAKSSSALSDTYAGWTLWRDGGTVPATADGVAYHTPGLQGLLSAIRAAGANNLVWAGGRNWAFNLNGLVDYGAALTDTAAGNGVVYGVHIYPFKWGGNGCTVDACFDQAVPAAVKAAYPVMITEFGPNVGDPEGFLSPLLNWIEANQFSFSAWCMHPSAAPCLISDWSFSPTSYFGAPFLNKLLGTNPLGCNPATATVSPTVSPTPTVTVTATALPACGNSDLFRVNAGGTAYSDGNGDAWVADQSYTGGSTSSTTITVQGTADPTLFKTNRWGNPLIYSFSVPNGSYRVQVLESENYWSAAGKRVFDIVLQGVVVQPNYDVYAASGGKYQAVVLSYNTTVSNGSLVLRGNASVDNAQFAGVRVTWLGPPCAATPTISPSFSVSPTFSASPTESPTWTASPLVSPTPSATITPTWTASPTASPSATSPPSQGPLEIRAAVPLPNPNPRELAVDLSTPAERVRVDFFSVAYGLAASLPAGELPAGRSRVALAPATVGLPNGVYFVRLRAWHDGVEVKARACRLVLLR